MELQCESLAVAFASREERIQALQDVTFELKDAEFLSIIGPSGCGKTTLLRAIAGIIGPERGRITRNPPQGSVRLVFQENSLLPWMTVLENAAFGLEMQGVSRTERRRRALALLDRFGLGKRENAYPSQLSLGMKQRVAVIRAFLSGAQVLLMDEPFAALDWQTRLVLGRELMDLWETNRMPVIFVTHDIDEAILLSDRILVLSARPGRVIADFPVRIERPRDFHLFFESEFLHLKMQIARELGMPIPYAAWAGL